jgi:putative hemolysin
MNKDFRFIDGTKNDKFTRRLARSHAMKGKNVGKVHQRRSQLSLHLQRNKGVSKVQTSDSEQDETRTISMAQSSSSPITGVLGHRLLSVSFPVEATPQSLGIVNQCKLYCSVNGYKEKSHNRQSLLLS